MIVSFYAPIVNQNFQQVNQEAAKIMEKGNIPAVPLSQRPNEGPGAALFSARYF